MNTPGGKGSAPRPFSVSTEEYARRWDEIFGREKLDPPDANQHPECAHPFCACDQNCRAPGNDR